jgi:hypothetical protein
LETTPIPIPMMPKASTGVPETRTWRAALSTSMGPGAQKPSSTPIRPSRPPRPSAPTVRCRSRAPRPPRPALCPGRRRGGSGSSPWPGAGAGSPSARSRSAGSRCGRRPRNSGVTHRG